MVDELDTRDQDALRASGFAREVFKAEKPIPRTYFPERLLKGDTSTNVAREKLDVEKQHNDPKGRLYYKGTERYLKPNQAMVSKAVNELQYRPWVDRGGIEDRHRLLKKELSMAWNDLGRNHIAGMNAEMDQKV
jgi:hypothetical protein